MSFKQEFEVEAKNGKKYGFRIRDLENGVILFDKIHEIKTNKKSIKEFLKEITEEELKNIVNEKLNKKVEEVVNIKIKEMINNVGKVGYSD